MYGHTQVTEWREIQHFPGYSVSDTGYVRNDENGYVLALLKNQAGLINVGITRDRVQYKRSVALLVAHAFVHTARPISFNTPINLDGDRTNNHASNLIWRPRWFAVKYFQQFRYIHAGLTRPIEEKKTQEIFETSWDAATKFGLLDEEIKMATLNRTYVWPTFQQFRILP